MAGKKLPGRFTLQFNASDPHQKAVIDILNQQGRSKAQFLTTAVLHYINCTETPDYQLTPQPSFSIEELEKMVVDIMSRKSGAASAQAENEDLAERPYMKHAPSIIAQGDSGLDRDDLSAIAHSLAAFRAG